MPGGRPTKLTPAVKKEIIDAVTTVVPLHWACKRAGVDPSTLKRWRDAANQGMAKKNQLRSTHQRNCIQFFIELEAAEAAAITFAAGQIRGAGADSVIRTTKRTVVSKGTGDNATTTITDTTEERTNPGDWRALAWILERRVPADFGNRSALELSGADGGPVAVITVDDVWVELEAIRRQKEIEGKGGPAPA